MRQPLVAGNWKMNGDMASNAALVAALKPAVAALSGVDIAVCPSFVHIAPVAADLAGTTIAWGGQDLCDEAGPGAYTGEVSAAMLLDLGCRYVIVGHSERRALYGEDDALVAKKFALAHAAGLVPILCVGELLEQREAGETEAVIARQLDAVLDIAGGVEALADTAVIAYEPVWAIGTGLTASPEQAQAVHAFIRQRLDARQDGLGGGVRILYGGSVKPDNAAELFAQADIDGGLIGGASLQADSFAAICQAAVA